MAENVELRAELKSRIEELEKSRADTDADNAKIFFYFTLRTYTLTKILPTEELIHFSASHEIWGVYANLFGNLF